MKDSGRQTSSFREVVGERSFVRHRVPSTELKISNTDPTTEAEEVEEALRDFCENDR